jgi:ClpP class serine protease
MSERRRRQAKDAGGAGASGLLLGKHWMMTPQGWEELQSLARSLALTPETAKAIEAKRGEWLPGSWQTTVRDGVATIPVRGVLMAEPNDLSWWYGWSTYTQIAQDYRMAIADSSIRGVLLDFRTPGGEVAGVSETADIIRVGSDKKPVAAYSSGPVASAGYWLAAACPRVVLADIGMAGCVGTMFTSYDYSELERKIGIEEITVISSQTPRKNLDPKSKEGRAALQVIADELAAVFLGSLARYRPAAAAINPDFGAGALLVGASAVTAGLADAVGTYEDLLAELAGDTTTGAAGALRPGVTMKTTTTPPAATAAAATPPAATPPAKAADDTTASTCPVCGKDMVDGACPDKCEATANANAGAAAAAAVATPPAAATKPAESGQDDLIATARKDERIRIVAIRGLNGPDAIKDKAIEDGVTPAEAALRINQAQGQGRGDRLAAIKGDDAGAHASTQSQPADKSPAAAAKAAVDQYLVLTGQAKSPAVS